MKNSDYRNFEIQDIALMSVGKGYIDARECIIISKKLL
jgi:hypothetical protein